MSKVRTERYSQSTCKQMAIFASHAYDSVRKFEAFLNKNPSFGYDFTFVYDEKTDTQSIVLVAKDKTDAIILFRGTYSTKNWYTDIEIDMEKVKYFIVPQNVHRGFNNAYEKVRKRVLELVEDIPKIEVSGHSLGAALATLCALDIKTTRPAVDLNVYTFGSPRVGDKKFVKYFAKFVKPECSFRFVNAEDPVPKVPPTPIGFKHVSTLCLIGKIGKFRRFLRKYLHIRFMFIDLRNHKCKNYIKNI